MVHPKNFHLFCVCVGDVVRLEVDPWRGCKFFSGIYMFINKMSHPNFYTNLYDNRSLMLELCYSTNFTAVHNEVQHFW